MTSGDGPVRRRPPAILGVVSDLDGTLLGSRGSLSPATLSMLQHLGDLGVPMVVATGRTPRAVRRIAGYQGLGRMVCANGAIVWDAESDEVVRERWFDPSSLCAAVGRLKVVLPGAAVALLSADVMFVDDAYRRLRRKGATGAVVSDLSVVPSRHRIVMVAVRHPHLPAGEILTPAAGAFAGVGCASVAGPSVVDIAPQDITKTVAVAEEMADRGCPAESAVVFGDMPNDLPLFGWAGWSCAVANGHASVLAAADEIVAGHDDDGVARAVRRLLRV